MNEPDIKELKDDIIAIGRLLWEKELVSGLNGNISRRVDDKRILITSRGSCLGILSEKHVVLADLDGNPLEEGQVSSEKLMHTEVYKNFPETGAVVHTHTNYTNAYFINNEKLVPQIFESKFYLGEVKGIKQTTPSVTDAGPVIKELKSNNIVALRNHGVVAMGKDLFDCFLLIQALEDAVKIDAISRLYRDSRLGTRDSQTSHEPRATSNGKKYKLFSKEQINEIVRHVNADKQLKELGAQTNMTMDLAVKLDETGQVYRFRFEKGAITDVGEDDNAEFVINAPEKVWRAVFNQEIDPFVATTQKKMHLKGDFAKISKWYAPCSRVFELWQQVPVE